MQFIMSHYKDFVSFLICLALLENPQLRARPLQNKLIVPFLV